MFQAGRDREGNRAGPQPTSSSVAQPVRSSAATNCWTYSLSDMRSLMAGARPSQYRASSPGG